MVKEVKYGDNIISSKKYQWKDKNYLEKQIEILELNSAITEMKNLLEELNRNLNWQKK